MKNREKNIFIGVCVIPTLLLYIIFGFYPKMKAILMAFYDWSGLSDKAHFIGLDNFNTLIHDPKVWQSLWHNLYLLITVPIVTMLLSLFFAFLLTRKKMPDKNFYRTVFFFPTVLSLVVISILWMFIYHPTLGILNSLLDACGLDKLIHVWLGEKQTVLPAIGVTMVWQAIGYYMVIYMASMEGVPNYLYEAAIIDGASQFRQFKDITFPLIWEVVRVTIIFNILAVFNGSFAYVNIMTAGGPDNESNVLAVYMYNQAFKNGNFGYAMAIGIFILIISVTLALLSHKLTKRDAIQY